MHEGEPATSRTEVASPTWTADPGPDRRYERSTVLGHGDDLWHRAAVDVLRWAVKTRSGFRVDPADEVRPGARPVIRVGVGPVTVREPVEVVEVVRTSERVGFAYRTLPGHPVSGEEAFVVTRRGDEVALTIRSLTAPSTTPGWALVFPLLRLAQDVVRRRYARALR